MVQTFMKRPTSPLVYEPLYTPPEEILYPGSDEEAIPDERQKKRLRVEIQGRQYLDGRPLFIQSAALRGPFEKGWVNPWASKKRKYGVDDIRRFPEAATQAFPMHSHVEVGSSTAKRRSVGVSGYGSLDYGSDNGAPLTTETSVQGEPMSKRRRHGEPDEPHGCHGSRRNVDWAVAAPERERNHWLKTNKAYPQARLRDVMRSSTPTPAAKPRSKSYAPSSPHPEQLGRAITLPPRSNNPESFSRSKAHALDIGSINTDTMSAVSEEAHVGTIQPATIDLPPDAIVPDNDVASHVRERSLSKVDITTRHGYDEVKRLSQQAVRRAEVEDGQLQAKTLSQEAVARAIERNKKTMSSRLAPYASEAVVENDAASSAALRAAKSPKAKPSPHAVPPSTYQPEFRYRYARKGTSTSISPQRAPFVDAPEQPQTRLRSDSPSSSGSSAFAEALEAAQEKTSPKSFASSKSSSPAIEGPDTKSVKKNRKALRRLTFTPSGGARVAPAQTSSRPSSSSSVAEPGKIEMKRQDKPSSNDPPSLLRTSTKSSARSLTNGNQSRNSIVFPEAQTDPIAHPPLAQAPSGPSATLLETDKQSSKIPSFDEADSYLDLSTQAAVSKAQRSFQADVVSALTPRRPKKQESSPTGFGSSKTENTSRAHGRRKTEAANAHLSKPSDSDDEEPMSTQAMVDAISPFAVTTVKKRPPAVERRTSLIPSPTKKKKAKSPIQVPILAPESPTIAAFHTHSPGMSTSPSPTPSPRPEKSLPPIPLSHPATNSKPQSSLTSFSILPNGTLTETSLYQQDGQQQEDIPDYDTSLPLDPFGFDDAGGDGQRQDHTWDLSAAIEEAGSFLGDWNVEAEARKVGHSSRKRESGNRSTLKGSA
ncbi:MAG: hypothetical protein Q9161_005572 [Pseudevernia consocians]